MGSFVPMTHPQYFTPLKQAYFPLFHAHHGSIIADSEIRTIIPDELHLFEQKQEIEVIDNIQQKIKPANIKNISFVMCKCNEKLIVQSIDFLLESAIAKFLIIN